MLKQFTKGLLFIFTGFAQIKANKGLKRFLILPLVIDALLLVVLFSVGLSNVSVWVGSALSFLNEGAWYFFIYYPLLALAWVSFLVFIIYLTFILSTIIAAPFNVILSEKVLLIEGVITEDSATLRSWWALTVKMLRASLIKAFVFTVLALVLFVLAFIPVINVVASFVVFLIMSFDCFDYAFESARMTFSQRVQFFIKHLSVACGMATSLMITLLLPGLTILVLPLGVAGASFIFAELKKDPS